jgi:HlyD family secretion protein
MGMDIALPSNARARAFRRVAYGAGVVLLVGAATLGLSRLRPAPPTVDRATVWVDTVKRGSMLREVRGLGTLVPEEIRWIPAQTEGRVDRILIRPGAVVKSDTVILELSNPELQRDVLDAEYQLKGAEADYASLKVQMASELLNQKAVEAGVASEHKQASLQAEVDEQLNKQGLTSDLVAKMSRVKAEQLGIRTQLEGERTRISADSAKARLASQQARVEQQRALYELRRTQLEALRVRAGIGGVLQLVPVEVGARVTPGTNLARVADPTKLKAEIKIPETQAKDVLIGQTAAIDTRNGVVAGRVARIDPAVQNGTVTVDVAIDDALPPGARPDLSVEGTLEIENLKDIVYVGRPVFGQADSTVGIFKLVDGDAEAVRVNVKLGRTSVNTMEVVEGLHVGDKVVLSDMSAWDAFDRVRLR